MDPLDYEPVRQTLMALPQIAAWPEVASLFAPGTELPSKDYRIPLYVAKAVGGEASAALPGAAAIACLQMTIVLVDDLLDDDPRGAQKRIGIGPAANIASALQAAAFAHLDRAQVSASARSLASAALAQMLLDTALGQRMDVLNEGGEEEYWQVAFAKSSPFCRSAFAVGAILGGGDERTVSALTKVGALVGETQQLHDDLDDALAIPAQPDWRRPRNNLLTLYALTVDHPDRERFVKLLEKTDQPDQLREAQAILSRSGAVSYCAYHLVKRHKEASDLVADLELADAAALSAFMDNHFLPAMMLLERAGLQDPKQLLRGGA
jgi:geranylgeranyl diphosphate synthase, type I